MKNLKKSNHSFFYYLIRQIKKDNSLERKKFVQKYIQDKITIKLLYLIMSNLPSHIKSLGILLYSVISTKSLGRFEGDYIYICSTGNEINHFEKLSSYKALESLRRIILKRNIIKNLKSLDFKNIRKIYGIIYKISKKYDLYVSLRASNYIFFYYRYCNSNYFNRCKYIFFSSEGGPYINSVLAIKNLYHFKTIYTQHSLINNNPLKFNADIGLFIGENGLREFKKNNSSFIDVVYYDFEEEFVALKDVKKIGICLGKVFDEKELKNIVNTLEDMGFEPIIRPHPNLIQSPNMIELDKKYFDFESRRLEDFVKRCDFFIAGNSNCHMHILSLGSYSVYYSLIDLEGEKLLPFIKDGTVATVKDLFEISNGSKLFDKVSSKDKISQYESYFKYKTKKEFEEELKKIL